MRLLWNIVFFLLLLSIVVVGLWQLQWDLSALEAWISKHHILGGVAYVTFVAASVVVLPFTSLPLLPSFCHTRRAIASLIGITPFAFVWSYAGGELGRGAFLSSSLIFIAMTVAVLVIRRLWKRHH